MLLYDSEIDRSSAEIDCINQALAYGDYCLYATVDADNEDFVAELAPRITDYEKNVLDGNFKIVNFKPFYDSAANGELGPFRQLKNDVEKTLKDRVASGKSAKALLVADAACNLARHKQFDECVTLESWWQQTYNDWMGRNLDITIICAHPSSVLKQRHYMKEQDRIAHVHSLTLDLTNFIHLKREARISSDQTYQPVRILIVEPEADIRTLYRRYIYDLPVEITTVSGANDCLELDHEAFDIVMIDTHTKDANGLHTGKKILEKNPDQQLVFTTTWDNETMRSELAAHSIKSGNYRVLQKPFVFSDLLALMGPAKSKISL